MYRNNMGRSPRFGSAKRFGARPVARKAKAGRSQFSDVSKFINKVVSTTDEAPYVAKNTFADFCVDERLKKNVTNIGYTEPTPIQDQVIPHILSGKDLVGIANTGTGKTAAFLVPLLDKVLKDKNQKILIIAPTRELAIQINQEFMKLARGFYVYSVCIVGGMSISRQIGDLRRNYNFVVGTPGRIKDLAGRKNCLPLNRFQSVVLDEADRMLDMGFINDVRNLLARLPVARQTLFFSATLSNDIKRIINDFLKEPANISVKTGDTAKGVDQDVIYVRDLPKFDLLNNLLNKPEFSKVLIFGRTKHGVENLSGTLARRGHKTESIHGNKNHNQRQRALRAFKENSVKILVATDVAARGLDIPNISHVINYELPATYEDYIHRIGRTGRAGKTGIALTFID
ncbi:MAG: ATP-dependent helicase [Candidatus Portnoybacteria bacterium CG10_big_fil_rev_8_21_14_0_10_36_7]|uniref:ATP-dependent helicase n=1 Tax=Candidatus Portnoybacteria bacterium CG10_big_fil_rev_8_21_14_0_10_36_7 TaxID=1974812 RepID=A0A2M8KD57_9BACT|nr:MAG: ATP-dependent helicase [Candidatus Portnoybacteria bacterium CG10_big_fil_rev_8_21_14_0_10_36_7]